MHNPEYRLTSGDRQDRSANAMQALERLTRATRTVGDTVCSPAIINNETGANTWVYWGLLQPHQRLMSKEMAGIGFENVLTFNGSPLLADSHQQANTMYFLNEDFLKLYVHSQEDMRFEKITQIEGQAATLGRIFFAGNLVCSGRRFQGLLDDLLTS